MNTAREFHDLGTGIETRWRATDYDEQRFPEIAEAALQKAMLPGRVDPWAVVRTLHTPEPLTEQRDVDARFSDLPLTVFNGPRFYIDLYFWLDGTTEIHQHAFAGAFQVLLGSSLHSRYTFAREREINPRFLIGRVSLKDVDILKPGDVRQIIPGPDFVHSLFHLDRPSVTLTVRTHHTPTAAPQYSYLKPFFAIDPFHKDPALAKKVQSAFLLLRMRHPDADAIIGDMLTASDFETAFRLLEVTAPLRTERSVEAAFGLSGGERRMDALLEIARSRHGTLVDLVPPVLQERRRQSEIARRRATITSEAHRFLLALLLNVTDRTRVIDLVARRFPDEDPIETIVEWVQELGTIREFGAKENVLGVSDWDDDHVFAFECLLRDGSDLDIASRIDAQYSKAGAEKLRARVEDIFRRIRDAAVFKETLAPRTRG